MSENKILVIGDIMLDRYVYGTVERICPEAPVPVLNYKEEKESIGGAGVVANTLAKLRYKVKMISVVGDDETSEKIIELCKKAGIDGSGITKEKNRRTTVKTRYVAVSPFFQYILRVDKEQTNPILSETQEEIIKKIKDEITKCSAIVISDYKKGMMTEKIVQETIAEATKQKKTVIVDTKGKILDYKGAAVILPNRRELFENSDEKYTTDMATIKKIARNLAMKMKCDVVVKLGEDGVLLASEGKELLLPSEAKKVVNVSGAGDVFTAIIAGAIADGKKIEDAVKLANKGAGIAISKETPTITYEELYEKSDIS